MCCSIQDDQLKVNHSLIGGISEFVREDGERSKDSKKIEGLLRLNTLPSFLEFIPSDNMDALLFNWKYFDTTWL